MKETTNGLLDAEGTCEQGSAEADQVHSSYTWENLPWLREYLWLHLRA
jgi:hypothetical protein